MKLSLLLFIVFTTTFSFGQKLKIKINGQKDTTVFLLHYVGKGLYYADTAEIKSGVVEFDISKEKPGILALLLPQVKYFEFVYNKEDIDLETSGPDYSKNMKINKSEENKVFYSYIRFLAEKRELQSPISDSLSKLDKESALYKEFLLKNDAISKDIIAYQKKLMLNNPTKFVSKIVKISMDVEIPEAPKDLAGKAIDPDFAYHYYRDHYFDNVDFNDDRMVNITSFHTRLETYFGNTMMVQRWDSIVKYAFLLCDKLDPKSEAFKHVVSWITSSYEKSNILGMENVFVMMADKYYCTLNAQGKSPAHWVSAENLETLNKSIKVRRKLLFGMVPPNVILKDTTDVVWKDFYSIKADYTILYFWEPSCGHCKTTTPKLQKLYTEKLKARNIEVFSVAKAVEEEFELWKKFVKENNLTFITVGMTKSLFKLASADYRNVVPKYTNVESINYSEHFDIISTPTIYVLDKDKKIIAKKLSIAQLEDFLDIMQHQENSLKIFPLDQEKPEAEH